MALLTNGNRYLLTLCNLSSNYYVILYLRFTLRVSVRQATILSMERNVTLIMMIDASVCRRSLAILINCQFARSITLNVRDLFYDLLFPIVVARVNRNGLLFTYAGFRFSFEGVRSEVIFVCLVPTSIIRDLNNRNILTYLIRLQVDRRRLNTQLRNGNVFTDRALSRNNTLGR